MVVHERRRGVKTTYARSSWERVQSVRGCVARRAEMSGYAGACEPVIRVVERCGVGQRECWSYQGGERVC